MSFYAKNLTSPESLQCADHVGVLNSFWLKCHLFHCRTERLMRKVNVHVSENKKFIAKTCIVGKVLVFLILFRCITRHQPSGRRIWWHVWTALGDYFPSFHQLYSVMPQLDLRAAFILWYLPQLYWQRQQLLRKASIPSDGSIVDKNTSELRVDWHRRDSVHLYAMCF
jgi:hypothetical protein